MRCPLLAHLPVRVVFAGQRHAVAERAAAARRAGARASRLRLCRLELHVPEVRREVRAAAGAGRRMELTLAGKFLGVQPRDDMFPPRHFGVAGPVAKDRIHEHSTGSHCAKTWPQSECGCDVGARRGNSAP